MSFSLQRRSMQSAAKKETKGEKPEQSQAVNHGAQSRAFLRRDDASADGGTVFLKRKTKSPELSLSMQ